ncbi:hypothetical protein AJ79_06934 [Helicocarpus griseus UAMH5409]|uniref:Uncharacterized protein n=1 Tax=Helicocarpus griseus UAMH5409 TaxID=1447875 RepID=A0A2B7X8D6_9EURO|nr:hypothetical protein AJ79_06934 [Helicocarpus griseus UAMH5409]
MATQTQFQLFPQVQPQNRPNANPFRKTHRRRTTKSPISSPVVEDDKSSAQAEAVILQIIEDTNKTPLALAPPPPVHVARTKSPSPSLKAIGEGKPVISPPKSSNGRSPPPRSPPPEPIRSGSPVQIEVTTGETPARSPTSPVVPMKSIFPRYDPNLPLSQQRYYPQRSAPNDLPREVISRCDYSPSVTSPQSTFSRTMRQPTQLATTSKLSSTEQLGRLWDAANGDGPHPELGSFHLRISKTQHLTYAFGSDTAPLYSLKTNDMGDVEIQRSHPTKENTMTPVITLNSMDINRSKGTKYLTVVFPILAGILARDQASSLSRQHELVPSDAMEVEVDAVKRAESQESCVLEWNGTQGRYDVFHQALFNDPSGGSTNSTQSPEESHIINKKRQILHLTVSSTNTDSVTLRHPPSILLTIPGQDSTKDTPLVALDLETMTLSISAGVITSIIPALYCIDSLVAAVLITAVTDQSTRSILADMDIAIAETRGEFPLPSPSLAASVTTTPQPRFTGKLIATQAEREDAEHEAELMAQIYSPTSSFESDHKPRFFFWRRSHSNPKARVKAKKPKKKTPLVIEEIDLERYGRYSSGPREGQKLPGVTRSVLKLLFWGFKSIIWGLTVVVKFLAWLLVSVTRCFTSEKF